MTRSATTAIRARPTSAAPAPSLAARGCLHRTVTPCGQDTFCFALGGQCHGGTCRPEGLICNDGDVCTVDVCDEAQQTCMTVAQTNDAAAHFDALDESCVEVPSLLTTPWASLTIAFWYYPESSGGSDGRTLIDKAFGTVSGPGFNVVHTSCCDLEVVDLSTGSSVSGNIGLFQWVHVAVVFDAQNGRGAPITSMAARPTPPPAYPNSTRLRLHVGCTWDDLSNGAANHLDGHLDDLHISSVARYGPGEPFLPPGERHGRRSHAGALQLRDVHLPGQRA